MIDETVDFPVNLTGPLEKETTEETVDLTVTDQPLSLLDEKNVHIINRLGCLTTDITTEGLLAVLYSRVSDLLNRMYDTLHITNNEIEILLNSESSREDILKELCREIMSVYFTAKLISLKCTEPAVDLFQQSVSLLITIFEGVLKIYSLNGADTVSQEEFNVILSTGLLTVTLVQFIGEESRIRTEQAFALLFSLAPLQQIVTAFRFIIPPAHQSYLFTLTLYHDLQIVETGIDAADLEQTAKLKGIMEIVLIRYGDFFRCNYIDEVLFTFNQKDLLDCPTALWNKATHGGSIIQTELGPSFLVSMIKYQWGIIKDYNGIVPDPLTESILFYTELENLFDFLFDQGQQLFLLVGALYTVLNDDPSYQSTFIVDAEILTKIFVEMMDHISRIITALDDYYQVASQCEGVKIERIDKMRMLQETKLYILIHSLSVCMIQMSLTGPLNISTTPSLSPVIEYYFSKSDFSAAIMGKTLIRDFKAEFKNHAVLICSNYSMIKNLSIVVLAHLEGRDQKSNFLNSGMSWNMLCFTVLVGACLLVLLAWFIQVFLKFLEDCLII